MCFPDAHPVRSGAVPASRRAVPELANGHGTCLQSQPQADMHSPAAAPEAHVRAALSTPHST
eukprot:4780986-Prymnesium_polylepis.1